MLPLMAVELKEKDLFQSIFESSVEGILVVGTNGVILSANPAIEHIFGYAPRELINKNLEILIPEKFKKKHISHREGYAKNPKTRPMGRNLALLGLKKNGSKFPVKVSLSPTMVKGQSITIAFVSDATELKIVTQELAAKEAKDKALLEAIPDMMIIQNYQGDVIDFYAPDQLKLQVPKEGFIGKNIQELVPPTMAKAILKAHSEAVKTKQLQIREYSLNTGDGNVNYEARTVCLNNHSLLTIIRDITERKRVDEELKASEAKNSAILSALPDIIIIHDKEGNFLDILAAEPSSLFTKEEVIGKNLKDIFPPDVSKEMIKILAKTHKTKSLQVLKIAAPGKDRIIDLEGRVTPFEDDKLLVVVRDITKSKAVEDILYVRNRALEAAGNGIIIVDAQQPIRPIIYTNDAFSQITGYGKSEVLGKNCRFLQNGDRDQKEIGIIRKAIKAGRPCHEVLRNYKKDGTLFWNDLTITPLYNDQGSLTHFIGVQSDVTEQKKAVFLKDQIRKVLEMTAQHWPLDFIGNAIVETVEQHIENCLASILLLDREKGTLHNLSAPNLPESLTQALEGQNIGPNICSCCTAAHLKKEMFTADLTKDPFWKGHRKLLMEHNLKSCWSLPIMSSSQEVLGVLALYYFLSSVAIEQHHTRITLHENRKQLAAYAHELEEQVEERTNELKATVQKLVETNLNLKDQVLDTKSAENRAMASQTMFTAIARNFPKGVIIVFNTEFDIVYIDGGELHRMGLDKTEFEGINIIDTDIFSKERIDQIKDNIKKTMEGEHLSFEIEFRRRNYSVNTSPLYDDDHKVKWTLFVYNDITKQKQAERNIRSALVREQELNELKSRFISMASHEFRTPLSAILSSAILIGKQNEPGKEVKREKYIGQIKTNVRNLVVILNDFLSLSKLEEGKVRVHKEKFDIVPFSKSLVDEIDSSKKYGQKIAVKHKKPTINVFLDPKLTRHILTNLLSNAIKYSQENKNIDLILDKNQKNVVIKVVDQGIGIPKEEQSNLFQRFFRADNSSIIQGTGLGLHIVKQYVELMGGHVSFESELNKGATFIVEIPIE
jgi:PAS domain S-box-containing protein